MTNQYTYTTFKLRCIGSLCRQEKSLSLSSHGGANGSLDDKNFNDDDILLVRHPIKVDYLSEVLGITTPPESEEFSLYTERAGEVGKQQLADGRGRDDAASTW
jgi:hypothetical protein